MGRMGCPETSVANYQYTLREIAKERWSHCLNLESTVIVKMRPEKVTHRKS